jgi:hypothetical protein
MQVQYERSGGGVIEMRMGLIAGLVLALAATSGAHAFQEQKAGSAPPAEAQPQAPAQAAPEKGLDLSEDSQAKEEAGKEIRIPGLGKLGVLPKMDFGLELLYGAADQKQQAPEAAPSPEDDLMIRGTVKHRF